MCGIVGVAAYGGGAMTGQHRSIFQNMLVASSARGIDGTGVFKINTEGNVKIVKRSGDPFNLFKDESFQKMFWEESASKEWNRWLVGHNRWATKGKKNTRNAHPFTHKGIILVHNGALRYGTEFDYHKFEVDSEAICHSVGEVGLAETWKKINGAYAIAFYDHNTKTFNIARNKERPLWIGFGKSSKSVYFASEPDLLRWAVQRNRTVLDDLVEVETNMHYKWNLDKDKYEPEKIPLEAHEQLMDRTFTDEKFGYWDNDNQVWVDRIQQSKELIITPDSPEFSEVGSPPAPKQPEYNPPVSYSGQPYGEMYRKKKRQGEENVYPFPQGRGQSPSYSETSTGKEKVKDYLITPVLNGLSRLQRIDVRYYDYDELKDNEGKTYFMVKAGSPLYGDIEFRIRYSQPDGENGFWEGISGTFIRGTVVSLLIPSGEGIKKGKTNIGYITAPKTFMENTGKEVEFELESTALATFIKKNKGKHPFEKDTKGK